jgi:CheY-like chemotaxis protein
VTTVIVIDDDTDMRLLVRVVLEAVGSEFEVAAEAVDGPSGLDSVTAVLPPDPDVVLLDNRMPGLTGVEVAERLRVARPDVPVVLFSAHLDASTEEAAAAAGVVRCVSKDHVSELPAILRSVVAEAAS